MTLRCARLALEDGSCFEGVGCGAEGVTSGEVVFNTSMTGYQEILTDPSYAGQIVTMTCPEVGNYGTTALDAESRRPFVAGFIVRECSPVASNWRSAAPLHDFLRAHHIVALAGIDTRALTRRLRAGGVLRGAIGTGDVSVGALDERADADIASADRAPQHTARAQAPRQRTRVDTGQRDDVVGAKEVVKGGRRSPIARHRRALAHDEPGHERTPRFRVERRRPVVAHLRARHRDDLARVGRISQDFLVAGHARIEHDLAGRDALGTAPHTFEATAILERPPGAAQRHRP